LHLLYLYLAKIGSTVPRVQSLLFQNNPLLLLSAIQIPSNIHSLLLNLLNQRDLVTRKEEGKEVEEVEEEEAELDGGVSKSSLSFSVFSFFVSICSLFFFLLCFSLSLVVQKKRVYSFAPVVVVS
jgi:hypothetical protein